MYVYEELQKDKKFFSVTLEDSDRFLGLVFFDFEDNYWKTPKKDIQYSNREKATVGMMSMFESKDTLKGMLELYNKRHLVG